MHVYLRLTAVSPPRVALCVLKSGVQLSPAICTFSVYTMESGRHQAYLLGQLVDSPTLRALLRTAAGACLYLEESIQERNWMMFWSCLSLRWDVRVKTAARGRLKSSCFLDLAFRQRRVELHVGCKSIMRHKQSKKCIHYFTSPCAPVYHDTFRVKYTTIVALVSFAPVSYMQSAFVCTWLVGGKKFGASAGQVRTRNSTGSKPCGMCYRPRFAFERTRPLP